MDRDKQLPEFGLEKIACAVADCVQMGIDSAQRFAEFAELGFEVEICPHDFSGAFWYGSGVHGF